MRVPLLDLKAALRLVPEFKSYLPACVNDVYSEAKPKHSLTREEAAAVTLYTAQCEIYRDCNAALRTQDRAKIEPWFQFLKLFQTGIENDF